MSLSSINRDLLQGYEGLHISAICTVVRFDDDEQNHCAHFVNHVIGFAESLTCAQLFGRAGTAANIRVHETFARCPKVGPFDERPDDAPCFAFVTKSDTVDLANGTMVNIPKKHIGICCDGEIWHYSNSARKVMRERPEAFQKHFAGAGFGLFFGTFPAGARALLVPAQGSALDMAVVAPVLQRGQRDDIDVAVWQQFLILRGLLEGSAVHALLDGDFGAMTEDATEAFQASAGLSTTGSVDQGTNAAARARGFIPRAVARPRAPIKQATVTPAMTVAAVEALHRLGRTSVFYTEELLDLDGVRFIARLEPHKHSEGSQLRYWHRGITLHSP